MNKKLSLAEALQEVTGKKEKASFKTNLNSSYIEKKQSELPVIRKGKKVIAGHFDPAVSKQIKQIALDGESTVQNLLTEALNDLFVKYNKKPIA